jgi:hypothetical protein
MESKAVNRFVGRSRQVNSTEMDVNRERQFKKEALLIRPGIE